MANHFENVLGYLRKACPGPDAQKKSDQDLLREYAQGGHEGAFALLVQRHGAMVMAACQRVLRDENDVDDAFQTLFVILARKAATMNVHGSLAPWLYTVAVHLAMRIKAKAARRQNVEGHANLVQEQDCDMKTAEMELLRGVLDDELQRLPRKYREPLILCYLQGKTHEEASRELGWPKSSMGRWLGRARDILHERLQRRGLTAPSTTLAFLMAEEARAFVPAHLCKAAAAIGAGVAANSALTGIVSVRVVSLAEEVVRAMAFRKIRALGAAILFIAATALTSGLLAHHAFKTVPPDIAAPVQSWVGRFPMEGNLEHIEFLPGSKVLVVGDMDGSIQFRDSITGKLMRKLVHPNAGKDFVGGQQFVISPNGRWLAAKVPAEDLILWNLHTGEHRVLSGSTGPSTAVAFSNDGRTLACAGERGVIFFETATWSKRHELPMHVMCINFSPQRALMALEADNFVHVLNIHTETVMSKGFSVPPPYLTWSPDGTRLAWYGKPLHSITVWDPSANTTIAIADLPSFEVPLLRFAPDSRTLVLAGFDQTPNQIMRIDLADQSRSWFDRQDHSNVVAMVLSPEGSHVAVLDNRNVAADDSRYVITIWESQHIFD